MSTVGNRYYDGRRNWGTIGCEVLTPMLALQPDTMHVARQAWHGNETKSEYRKVWQAVLPHTSTQAPHACRNTTQRSTSAQVTAKGRVAQGD